MAAPTVGHLTKVGLRPTAAASGAPQISRFYAASATLTKLGGKTVLNGTVSSATSCSLTVKPLLTGYPVTLKPCASISHTVTLPKNSGTKPIFYTFTLTAKGATTVKAVTMAVVAGSSKVKSLTLPATISTNTELSPAVASVYVLPGHVTVSSAATLTIAQGTIVKSSACGGSCVLDIAGALSAVGTSTSPITFTSINDNTIGGATGTGHPAAGNWAGILSESTGRLDLEYANVKYALHSVQAQGPTTILNDTFSSTSNYAVAANSSSLTVMNNTTTNRPGYSLTGSRLNLAQLSGNKGPAGSVVAIAGTLMTSSTLPAPTTAAWELNGCLRVPTGVTLTVPAGAVVKASGGSVGSCHDTLDVAGTLKAVGTSGSPIKFTSINDNSVGGATGSGSPGADWGGIYSESTGHIDLEYASVKYAGQYYSAGVYANGVSTTILHDAFASDYYQGVSTTAGTVNVSNNQFDGAFVTANGGTVTVSGNQFTNIANSYSAVSVGSSSALTVMNNTTDSGAGYNLSSSHLNLANVTGNTGPTGFVVGIAGTLTTSSTLVTSVPWELYTCLRVASGVTLTVPAGAVIKAAGASGSSCNSSLDVAGTLSAVGTSGSPITFTSVNDNSVGGANGASSGTPLAGDWGGIYSEATGVIDLEHANVKYTGSFYGEAVDANGTSTTILNDAFDSMYGGVYVSGGAVNASSNQFTNLSSGYAAVSVAGSSALTATNNSADSGTGYNLSSSHLNLANVAGDTGPAGSVVAISGTLTTSSTLLASVPWELYGCLRVASGVTLTVPAGAIVKASGWSGGPCYSTLDVAGTLNAVGTNGSPITFTSINDNSIGGATGSGSPAASDWGGIYSESGGSVDLEYADVSYGGAYYGQAVYANGTSTTVLNDAFNSMYGGVYANGGTVNVSSNQFTNLTSGYSTVSVASSSALTAMNNSSDSGTGYSFSSSALDLANVTGNTGPSGTGVAISGTVTTSSTLPAGSLPWELPGCLQVASGVTMTVAAGAVIKSSGNGGGSCNYGSLAVAGTLSAVGTNVSPINFTSINDSSVGGVTGGGAPSAGDWGGIDVASGGTVTCVYCKIRYASTGVNVENGGNAVVHSTLVGNAMDVVSSDAYVDASNSDWGSAAGPGGLVSGPVLVQPWVGEPAFTYPSATGVATSNAGCPDVLAIAVAGSGEPNGSSDYVSTRAGEAALGYKNEMVSVAPSTTVAVTGLAYPATSASDFEEVNQSGTYLTSAEQGRANLKATLVADHAACPSEHFVLFGYSQGALVVHLALLDNASSPYISSSLIKGVGLIADPAKNGGDTHLLWQSGYVAAGSGLAAANGVWPTIGLSPAGNIPSAYESTTVELCYTHDLICAPGLGASVSTHTSYTPSELADVGIWVADNT